MAIIFEQAKDASVFQYPTFASSKLGVNKHFQDFNKSKNKKQQYLYYDYDRLESRSSAKTQSLSKKMREKGDKFSTFEFIQDNTILTSVEDYAKRVRQDADRYMTETKAHLESLKEETEQMNSESKQMLEKTRAETETMISEAKDRVDSIQKEAEETGYREGFDQGKQDALEEGKQHFDRLVKMIREIEQLRVSLFKQHEDELVGICLILARMIVQEELKTNKNLVVNGLKRLIKRFEGMGRVKIKIHPSDYDFILQHKDLLHGLLDEDQKLVFRRDEQAGPGAPIIESDHTEIDLDIKKQFSVLDAKFQKCGDERAMLYKKHMKEMREDGSDRG